LAFSYYRAITIDKTKVPNTDQTDFPVLVSGTYTYLKTTGNGGDVTNANGYDIGFYSDSALTTKLKWETIKYVATTGQVIYRVKVPTVATATNTVIYIAYGDSGISTDQSDPSNTYDSNYVGVWNLPDGTTLSALDSTSNNGDGTITGCTAISTMVGDGGASFNGTTDKIVVPDSSPLDLAGTGNCTWSFQIIPTASAAAKELLQKESGGGWAIYIDTNKIWYYIGGGGSATTTLTNGVLYWITVVKDTTTMRFYLNGSTDGTAAVGASISATTLDLGIGNNAAGSNGFDGSLGNIKISNVGRSADWITTEYNNESSPSTFYSIGSAVSSYVPPAINYNVFLYQGEATTNNVKLRDPSALSSNGSITGTTSISLTQVGALQAKSSIVATSAIAITQAGAIRAKSAIIGTSAIVLSQSAVIYGKIPAAGTATITLTSTSNLTAKARISGTSSISLTPTTAITAKARIIGTSPITISQSGIIGSKANIIGTSPITLTQTGALRVKGSITATASITISQSAVIKVKQLITGSATVTISQAGALRVNAKIIGTSAITISQTGYIGQVGGNALNGTTSITLGQTGELRAKAKIIGTAYISLTPGAAISVKCPISGTSSISITNSATIKGKASIIGTSAISLSTSAYINVKGNLIGVAPIIITGVGSCAGQGSGGMHGTSAIYVSASGGLHGFLAPIGTIIDNGVIDNSSVITLTGATDANSSIINRHYGNITTIINRNR
jgi:hypothetical protein